MPTRRGVFYQHRRGGGVFREKRTDQGQVSPRIGVGGKHRAERCEQVLSYDGLVEIAVDGIREGLGVRREGTPARCAGSRPL